MCGPAETKACEAWTITGSILLIVLLPEESHCQFRARMRCYWCGWSAKATCWNFEGQGCLGDSASAVCRERLRVLAPRWRWAFIAWICRSNVAASIRALWAYAGRPAQVRKSGSCCMRFRPRREDGASRRRWLSRDMHVCKRCSVSPAWVWRRSCHWLYLHAANSPGTLRLFFAWPSATPRAVDHRSDIRNPRCRGGMLGLWLQRGMVICQRRYGR